MTLYVPTSAYGFYEDMYGDNGGDSFNFSNYVTPGTSDSEGSWDQCFASTSRASHYLWIGAVLTASITEAKDGVLDVGIGAGGSEVVKISSLLVGGISNFYKAYNFPIYIPAGSRIAVRGQHSSATAGTYQVEISLQGLLSHPEAHRIGQGVETVGTESGSAGVSFTPGNTNTWGSWASIGTTVRPCFHWNFGHGCTNATMGDKNYKFQWGYGDASNPTIIHTRSVWADSGETANARADGQRGVYHHVPAGATIYVRGLCGTTADTGWNSLAYGTY